LIDHVLPCALYIYLLNPSSPAAFIINHHHQFSIHRSGLWCLHYFRPCRPGPAFNRGDEPPDELLKIVAPSKKQQPKGTKRKYATAQKE
jgi:hypothetical protein